MEILISVYIFILGVMLGSFYACISYRIPNKISIIKPRSFCPKCKKPLKWYMNIPLFSYIVLHGKCAYCKEKISPSYFITELITGLLFLLTYLVCGFTRHFFILIVLFSVLIITCNTDFKYYYISDRVILIGTLLMLLIRVIYKDNIIPYLVNSAILFTFMLIIKLIGDKIFKRESLGGGDIKLMLLIGLTLKMKDALPSLALSSILALIASIFILRKNKEGIIPFGPFLILGTIIMYIVY